MTTMPPDSTSDLLQTPDHIIFSNFFDCWLSQQDRNLTQLYSSLDSHENESNTRQLVNQVMGNYEYYYRAKTAFARHNVLLMFTPTWTSRTDNLFIWVGGWRPTTAFHILYSKCGIQFEHQLVNMGVIGFMGQDLGGLSLQQMEMVDSLHRETVRFEKEISEEVASYQETVASVQLVLISHDVTEAQNSAGVENGGSVEAAMADDMEGKREKMKSILEIADILRLNTLKRIVDILNPMQAVHFLIAVTELLLRVHEFGKNMDVATRGRRNQRQRSSTEL